MEILLICSIAAVASLLTFFSGFGLGTILSPAFAVFFPIEVAIAMTAVVHFSNNLFKLALTGRHANAQVILRFGLPAVLASFAGAWVLLKTSGALPLYSYSLLGHELHILPNKLIVALLMIAFTLFEIVPKLANMEFHSRYLPLGGILSGFFGGLSGHQGALRSAFLARSGLQAKEFVATGVVIACLIDLTRLAMYSTHLAGIGWRENGLLVGLATLSAFCGAYFGAKLLKKTTLQGIQKFVSLALFLLALALGAGLI